MFNEVIFLGLSLQEIMLLCILGLLVCLLSVFGISVIRNRDRICFYSLAVRENGNISKVGISFIFLLLLITYQVFSGEEVSVYLVELLGVIFAAELGKQFVDNQFISKNQMCNIKDKLTYVDKDKKSEPARKLDGIDFNNL